VNNQTGSPILTPFPSWAAQDLNDPNGIRYVQSMEIDSLGRMWIVDVGRLYFLSNNASDAQNGSARLFIYDLNLNVFIRNYTFPDSVASSSTSFLNDIVIDQTRWIAYISNAGGNGSIVMYDYNSNTSWSWSHFSMQVDNSSVPIVIGNLSLDFRTPVDGIALSQDLRTLYYCPLSGIRLYSIGTQYLYNFNSYSDLQRSAAVNDMGVKGYSDGLAFSNTNQLFFGELQTSAVYQWNVDSGVIGGNANILVQDNITMQWPDTFAFDGHGNLWFVSNKLQLFLSNLMVFGGSEINFRIWKVYVNAGSYLEGNEDNSNGAKGKATLNWLSTLWQ